MYAEWAHETFTSRIAPLLTGLEREILPGVHNREWLQVCGPGEGRAHFRLFPGALAILWIEALGGASASQGAEPVAAALELLHNASLVHDDVIDGHRKRRDQTTLYEMRGQSFAVLAGGGLMGAGLSLLAQVNERRLSGVLFRLGEAFENMIAGQIADEPVSWSRIAFEDLHRHWQAVCRRKLALGNVSASLGAFWAGCSCL